MHYDADFFLLFESRRNGLFLRVVQFRSHPERTENEPRTNLERTLNEPKMDLGIRLLGVTCATLCSFLPFPFLITCCHIPYAA